MTERIASRYYRAVALIERMAGGENVADAARAVERNAAIVEVYRYGGSARYIASVYGISVARVSQIVAAHERQTGERLARPRRAMPSDARNAAIVEDFRAERYLHPVATKYGISRERVRQIVARHEQLTGETLPRADNNEWLRKELVLWRCPGCGVERRLLPGKVKLQRLCTQCHGRACRKRINDPLLEDTISRVLAGEKFYQLAVAAGYNNKNAHGLVSGVYRHLLRHNRIDEVRRIWPKGIPNWLRKHGGAAIGAVAEAAE